MNPAALAGGSGELHAYLDAERPDHHQQRPAKPWVSSGATVDTPVGQRARPMLTAKCTRNENAIFLEITVHGDPADPPGRRHRR